MRLWSVAIAFALGWLPTIAHAQSVEGMGGTEGAFADVQFLRPVVPESALSVFSRTRAQISYENEVDLFSALYLSYSSPIGVGPTLVGKIQSNASSADLGVHYFHGSSRLTVFALAAAELRAEIGASLFVISRYRHPVGNRLGLYASAELFSLWRTDPGHVATVERMRLGLEVEGWAAGLALNASHVGGDWNGNYNPGVFVRREL